MGMRVGICIVLHYYKRVASWESKQERWSNGLTMEWGHRPRLLCKRRSAKQIGISHMALNCDDVQNCPCKQIYPEIIGFGAQDERDRD